MPEFKETPHQIEVEMKISAYEGIGKHKADISIADILSHLRFKPGGSSRGDSGWLLTELNSRLAAPWTCLVVVLIAIPFGAAIRPAESVHGSGGQPFHLLRLFSDSKSQLRFWRGRPSAGLAGGVAAEPGFRVRRALADGEGEMKNCENIQQPTPNIEHPI